MESLNAFMELVDCLEQAEFVVNFNGEILHSDDVRAILKSLAEGISFESKLDAADAIAAMALLDMELN